MRLKNILLTFLFALPIMVWAQVTTSSITGNVKDDNGTVLEGATILAVHQPSGTQYTTVSKKGGGFTVPAARIGGPYKVTISYAGFTSAQYDGIFLVLGDAYGINATISTNTAALSTVIVSGSKRKTSTEKNGASTNVGLRQLQTLPTISRSITDFTRLTPQANGNSIAGRDGRYNNITVDGANLNNNFGLSTDALPGGGNPISLDAIEEITVNIAPYDVRQANFTGANIAAVTKSGTNTFHGSVYGYYKNQNFVGTKVGDVNIATPASNKNTIWGATLGGAIVKNKLFFFVNYEKEDKTTPPGNTYTPTGGSGIGNTSSVPIDSLAKLSNYLSSKYGYNTGKYDNFDNFKSNNTKFLGRLDWNISNAHKLTLKYSEYNSANDVSLSGQSIPNSAGSGVFTSVPRNGSNAMSFQNSNYGFKDVVKSASLELNSSFKSRFSNQFLATYTMVRDTRTTSAIFPFVDILATSTSTTKNNYMSFGTDPYSDNNDVKNNTLSLTDNFTYYAGKHTITVGGSYEYQTLANEFMPAAQSYYVYGSLNDFMTNATPKAFSLTYSLIPGQPAVYAANLKIGQLGFYAQDEVNINDRFKLTYGLRIDRPVYPEQPLSNPAIANIGLADKNGNGNTTNYSTGAWPKATNYYSPRAGFRWDVDGDKKLIIRGGTGLYTGRIPFVYLTNMPTNSGVYQFSAVATAAQLATIGAGGFNPNPTTYQNLFPQVAASSAPTGGFVVIDPNLKFPQIWRTNMAFDQKFGNGFVFTLEALYTKSLNDINMVNVNQAIPTSTVTLGGTSRPAFAANTPASRRLNPAYANAILLTNNNRGGAFSLTSQVSKNFSKGFYGSVAYTYTFATDITSNPGSQASSTWQGNATSGTQNSIESAYSGFAVPHRVVANLSYRLEYIKHLSSTFSFFYSGSAAGSYSYIYNGDINYDGNSADLMYIPKASEISAAMFTAFTTSGTTPVTFTAQQQSDAFTAYVAQDKYLSSHQGQNAERNGARYPWYNRVDFKFVQEIFSNIGKNRNTLELSLDCLNFLNLVNKNWGITQSTVVTNPLKVASITAAGIPAFNLATYTPYGTVTPVLVDRTFINNNTTSSTWGIQLGVHYKF